MKIVLCNLKFICLACILLFSACNSFRTFIGDYSVVDLDQPVWQEAYSEWTPEYPTQNRNIPRLNRNVLGGKLIVDTIEFNKGISVGGNAVFIYTPDRKAAFIEFNAGVDDASLLKYGQSKLEVICNGKVVQKTTLIRGGNTEHFNISLIDVHQVIILIKAETNVYTDLLMPRIVGIPGVRDALRNGKTYFDNFVFEKIDQIKNSKILKNDSIIFPAENNCIGLSNNFLSLIISPANGGKVISFKKSQKSQKINLSLIDFSDVKLHPEKRKRFSAKLACHDKWKWRVDDSGTLRLLSPPNLANGVRWSRTFQLISNVVRVTLMAKNCVEHEISWSFGTEFGIPENSETYFAAENAKPGFSLLSGSPLGVDVEKDFVCVKPIFVPKSIVAASAESWLAIKTQKSVFFAIAIEREKGFFPYINSRVMVNGNKAILFSEVTPLLPKNHFVQEQFWSIEPWNNSIKNTIEQAKKNIITVKEFLKYPYGKPTGRSLIINN